MKELLEQLKHENAERSERLKSGMLTEIGRAHVKGEFCAVCVIIKRMEAVKTYTVSERLYTASELVEACRRGEDGLAEYMNELNRVCDS
jgi:hypothetical protein